MAPTRRRPALVCIWKLEEGLARRSGERHVHRLRRKPKSSVGDTLVLRSF